MSCSDSSTSFSFSQHTYPCRVFVPRVVRRIPRSIGRRPKSSGPLAPIVPVPQRELSAEATLLQIILTVQWHELLPQKLATIQYLCQSDTLHAERDARVVSMRCGIAASDLSRISIVRYG